MAIITGTIPTAKAASLQRKRCKNSKINVPDAVAHLSAGLSLRQAAEIQGVKKQSLHEALQRYGVSVDRLQAFQEHRADVMDAIQERMATQVLTAPDEELHKRALPLMSSLGIAYDKARLERGQSTANVSLIEIDLTEHKRRE